MEVYKITCKVNNKVYIGSTKYTKEVRWGDLSSRSSHLSCVRDGDTRSLYEDIRRYGVDQFSLETIETLDDRLEAYRREDYWIKEYAKMLGDEMLYNQYTSACGHNDWSVPNNPDFQKKATESRRVKYGTANGATLTADSIAKARDTKIARYGTANPCMMHPESMESRRKKISKKILDKDTGEIIYGYQRLSDLLNDLGYEEFTLDRVKRSLHDANHKLRKRYPEVFNRFVIMDGCTRAEDTLIILN